MGYLEDVPLGGGTAFPLVSKNIIKDFLYSNSQSFLLFLWDNALIPGTFL